VNGSGAAGAELELDGPRFYLASSSPRRRELLRGVGLRFDVLSVDADESCTAGESPQEFVVRMACEKAAHAAARIDEQKLRRLPVLAADTCVTIADRIMGKPRDVGHARSMLRALSGGTHAVLTAVALRDGGALWHRTSRTRVTFDKISPGELDAYLASGEPSDKAGAYAIQGLGAAFVKRIEGSYTGVVGLPMYETRRLLRNIGVDWL
jgi:septum formation protein